MVMFIRKEESEYVFAGVCLIDSHIVAIKPCCRQASRYRKKAHTFCQRKTKPVYSTLKSPSPAMSFSNNRGWVARLPVASFCIFIGYFQHVCGPVDLWSFYSHLTFASIYWDTCFSSSSSVESEVLLCHVAFFSLMFVCLFVCVCSRAFLCVYLIFAFHPCFFVLQPSVAPQTHLTQSIQITHWNSAIPTQWQHWTTPIWAHIHTLRGWGGDWCECVYVWCSPGRPVFGEDLLSSSGPPTPFRALPTSSSSPPPFSPSKPCSRQSSSSDTDLSLTPKTGKNTWPRPPFPLLTLPSPSPHCGATLVVVF